MEESNPIFLSIYVVTFIIVWITALVSWFRMVTAKNWKTYLISMALFVGPILLFFTLAEIGGFIPESTQINNPPPDSLKFIHRFIDSAPPMQLFLLAVAGVTWIIGGNVLFISHDRRTNKKWWYRLNPFNPPFKDFNGREWKILVLLMVITLGLGMAALYIK